LASSFILFYFFNLGPQSASSTLVLGPQCLPITTQLVSSIFFVNGLQSAPFSVFGSLSAHFQNNKKKKKKKIKKEEKKRKKERKKKKKKK